MAPSSSDSARGAELFSAAVLAGGRSIRMATDKAFLRIGNEMLIERQLRCLGDTGAKELLISGRTGIDYSSFHAKVVYDDTPNAGPLAGLAALLKASSYSRVLVLAVDMPKMTAVMLQKILSLSENAGCLPVDEHGFEPLAAAYQKAVLPLAEQCLQRREFSMKAFAMTAVAGGLLRTLAIQPSERIYFTNWNHPSDFNPICLEHDL